MIKLYILYDAECAFCRQCLGWLERQPAFVPLVFIPLQSPEVGCRFPGIEKMHPEKELLVVGATGEVWQGGSAWVMCLWAPREYLHHIGRAAGCRFYLAPRRTERHQFTAPMRMRMRASPPYSWPAPPASR